MLCVGVTGFATVVVGVGEQQVLKKRCIRQFARPGDEPLRPDLARHSRDRRIVGRCDALEPFRKLRDVIAVAHPNVE